MDLRPYQAEAVGSIEGRWAGGDRSTLLVMATGTGKTIVMARVAEDAVSEGGRVLVLAHRGELLQQAADKIRMATGLRCSVEKAGETSLGTFERVTVGSVQTRPCPTSRGHGRFFTFLAGRERAQTAASPRAGACRLRRFGGRGQRGR